MKGVSIVVSTGTNTDLCTVEIQKNKKAESRTRTHLQNIGTTCQNQKIFFYNPLSLFVI